MPKRRTAYLSGMMAEFNAAKQAWWQAAEYETRLYSTELAEYKELHPMPRLKDFMLARKAERDEAVRRLAEETRIMQQLEAEWLAGEQAAQDEAILAALEEQWTADELAALEQDAAAPDSDAARDSGAAPRSAAPTNVSGSRSTHQATSAPCACCGTGRRARVRKRVHSGPARAAPAHAASADNGRRPQQDAAAPRWHIGRTTCRGPTQPAGTGFRARCRSRVQQMYRGRVQLRRGAASSGRTSPDWCIRAKCRVYVASARGSPCKATHRPSTSSRECVAPHAVPHRLQHVSPSGNARQQSFVVPHAQQGST